MDLMPAVMFLAVLCLSTAAGMLSMFAASKYKNMYFKVTNQIIEGNPENRRLSIQLILVSIDCIPSLLHQERRGACSPHSLILPVATHSTRPIYTLFRVPKGGMVGMGCQDEMVEMDSQEANGEKGDTGLQGTHAL